MVVKHEVVVCVGVHCRQAGQAQNFTALKSWLAEQHLENNLTLSMENCLNMCGAAPNLLLYPEDEAFNHVDETILDILKRRLTDES